MKKNNKLIWIAIIFLLGLISVLVYSLYFSQNSISVLPKPSTFVPEIANPQGDTILFKDERFSISYSPIANKYFVTIDQAPFTTNRIAAEEKILEITRTDKSTACKLNVVIGTFEYVDPIVAQNDVGLSFCIPTPKPIIAPPSPTLSISTNLDALQVEKTIPPVGNVEMADTKNAVFVYFSKPINPATIYVTISPNIGSTQAIHPVRRNYVSIVPIGTWQKDTTYTITLKAGLTTEDQTAQLKQDVTFQFTARAITTEGLTADEHGED